MNSKLITTISTLHDSWMKIRDACIDFWSGRPVLDVIVTAAVLLAHWLTVHETRRGDILAWTGISGQTAIFTTGAGVMSLIAGFAGVGIALYSSASGETVELVRKAYGKMIRTNWLNIICWLLLSASLCIVALAIDTKANGPAQWIFELAFLISILKFTRMVIVLRLILVAADTTKVTPEKPQLTTTNRI
jgi:hypothetical protein